MRNDGDWRPECCRKADENQKAESKPKKKEKVTRPSYKYDESKSYIKTHYTEEERSEPKEFDYTGGVGKIPDRPKLSTAWCIIGLGVVCVAFAIMLVGWVGLIFLVPLILGRK